MSSLATFSERPAPPVATARADWADAAQWVALAVQIAAIWWIAVEFRIENPAFHDRILPLALGGALVNHLIALPHRPAFFGALGLIGVLVVFGLAAGAWLIGLGLGLMALCHIPLAFRWRVLVLAGAGGALAAARASWITAPWPAAIWPILGSMFMFRLAIYLYELKHRGPAEPGLALSYFFLLPNVVFPLFPVIDFHTFRRTYYDRPALQIYNEGVRWILRGITHLVIYRWVYRYAVLAPADVNSTAEIVQYLVANFALYLRVSGQFHLAVGVLHLFGFRLPETHRFFYLASSFADLWRRINIYWKDFMQKMVYLPIFFAMKRHGETAALVTASALVIVVTWLLHSYQWFWILGQWLISATDTAFWGLLGICLVGNVLRERRRPASARPANTARSHWFHALRTAAMFATMAVLWGLWTSATFEDFFMVMRAATLRAVDVAAVGGVFGVVAVTAFVARRLALDAPSTLTRRRWWQHPLLTAVAPLFVLWVVSEAGYYVPGRVANFALEARVTALNAYDAERLQRGYYEQLVGVNRYNGQLWELYARAATAPDWHVFRGMFDRDDALETEIMPHYTGMTQGAVVRINRWGMRDKDYEQIPPPGTHRIAVLGQSYVMGAGVNDGEPFEALVEARLNRERAAAGLRYELLNFAVPNYSLAQNAIVLENGRVAGFKPTVVLLVGYINDLRGLSDYVWREVRAGRGFDDLRIVDALRSTGITANLSLLESQRRLRTYEPLLAEWALARAAAAVQKIGARPVFVLIPNPTDSPNPQTTATLLETAERAGFAVIDMVNVFKGHDEMALVLRDDDRHPNRRGHQILAERLYRELSARPELLDAPAPTSTAP